MTFTRLIGDPPPQQITSSTTNFDIQTTNKGKFSDV